MRISRKLVGIAAAGALIAGVGVATAAPASAAKTIGSATITFDPTMVAKLQAAGIAVSSGEGGTVAMAYNGSTKTSSITGITASWNILKKGSSSTTLASAGQIDLMNMITGAYNGKLTATCDNPQVTLTSGKPSAVGCFVPMGTAPTEAAPIFAITGVKVKTKKGTKTATGTVTLNGVTYVTAFNALLTGKPSGLFTDGEKFGTVKMTWTP